MIFKPLVPAFAVLAMFSAAPPAQAQYMFADPDGPAAAADFRKAEFSEAMGRRAPQSQAQPGDAAHAQAAFDRAELLRISGKLAEAQALYRTALAGFEAQGSVGLPGSLSTLAGMVNLHALAGDFPSADLALEKADALIAAGSAPARQFVRVQIAGAQSLLERSGHVEARQRLQRAQAALPAGNGALAGALEQAFAALATSGQDLAAARTHLAGAERLYGETLVRGHPLLVETAISGALFDSLAGEAQKALEKLDRLEAGDASSLPAEHPLRLMIEVVRGHAFISSGEVDKAVGPLQAAANKTAEAVRQDHPWRTAAREMLARALLRKNDVDGASRAAAQAFDAYISTVIGSHQNYAERARQFAEAFAGQRRFLVSEALLLKSLTLHA